MKYEFCPRCGSRLSAAELDGVERGRCDSDGCGFVHWDNPVPVAAVLLEHEGGVVLVRAPGWPESWFGLVTGFVERHESPAETALRELREELGLDGEIVSLIGSYAFRPMNQVIIAYHVRAAGEIRASDEIAAWKRIPIEKLRPWPQGTGEAVRDWLAARIAQP